MYNANKQFLRSREMVSREVLRTGTTTVGIVCSDGIVMATDTRATMGYFIAHKRAKKVYEIDDHVAMTIAGVVGDAQTMVELLRANSKLYRFEHGKNMPIPSAARLAAYVLFNSRYVPLILQGLIGGIDEEGPHIFAVDPLGSLTEERVVATGSGSPVAYGVLESQIKEGMSVKEVVPVVITAVKSAMKRDAASGDSFDVALVTSQGYRELTEEEKRMNELTS